MIQYQTSNSSIFFSTFCQSPQKVATSRRELISAKNNNNYAHKGLVIRLPAGLLLAIRAHEDSK
ncbi:hypothetical protein A8C56_06935 [Niabella ginsenosidivorans]|uniref:Uncharacterized protein n=1 Tax=Niabella ginsenosidivorans TaxID=1176587 RepID=A0A1A9HZB4_9BACT|nr:hypothetical protein A8C56_06935 [Niabella ginsenosidivorans]